MPALTPDVQRQLYLETDARFWSQTGYKPGQKLDPHNPLDAKMVPTYLDIYNKVKREWQSGTIAWTYLTPVVQDNLAAATDAHAKAAQSMDDARQAVTAGDHQAAAQHVDHARQHVRTSIAATQAAGQSQPPTVSHAHARDGAHRVMTFVMDASGQGHLTGDNAAAAMQVTQMTDQLSAVPDSPPAPASPALAPAPDPSVAPQDPEPQHHLTTGEKVGIGIAGAATLGLLIYGAAGAARVSGVPRRR